MVEKSVFLGIECDTYNVRRWKHKVGFHNRGAQWDTPMARWAGEGKDWILDDAFTSSQGRRH